MTTLGKLIYTSDFEYKVYALAMRDKSSSRVSVEIYVINPQGEMTDIVTIPKKDIYTKKTVFDFFYDMDGGFGRDEISKIANGILEVIKDESSQLVTQKKATMQELHDAVCTFIRNNAEELEDNIHADIFIKDDCGYVKTDYMNVFIKDNKELGYSKRVDVLKRLKIMGALVTGKNRPYDISVSVGGEKKHFYKVILSDELVDEAEEVISV